MNVDLGRAGWIGACVAFTLCALTACNAGPESHARASSAGVMSVTEAVRVATDRSALQQDVITLPGGERMRWVGTGVGFNHVLIGRVGPDGKRSITCVDSASDAEAFLAGPQGTGQ